MTSTAAPRPGSPAVADHLARKQFWHAVILALGLPLAGTLTAVFLALRWGLGWPELLTLFLAYLFTVAGLEVGFHRLFTHKAFQAPTAVRVTLGILGSMCANGPPFYWAANHRSHHQHSDHEGDPHSPHLSASRLAGFWHSYMGWLFRHRTPTRSSYVRDLIRDPALRWVNERYYTWVVLGLALPALGLGLATLSWKGALLGFLWGGTVRLFLVTQAAVSLTSFCHLVGARPHATGEQSGNVPWLVLPTFGQAWHNNHHRFPSSAILGFRWWQFDPGGVAVRLLQILGLASKVLRPSREQLEAAAREEPGAKPASA